MAPIDGQEYVSRRGGAKTQEAAVTVKKAVKKVARVAARDEHRSKAKAKPAKTAKSSRGRTM